MMPEKWKNEMRSAGDEEGKKEKKRRYDAKLMLRRNYKWSV